jgi:peptide subunit release factor RF-3
MLPSSCRLARDARDRPVALFSADWELRFFQDKNPQVILHKLPNKLGSALKS